VPAEGTGTDGAEMALPGDAAAQDSEALP
jgi:hypothetical protein